MKQNKSNKQQFFLHGVGNRFFQSAKKVLIECKESMIYSIFRNKKMTFSHKIKRIFQFLNIQLVAFVLKGSAYNLIAYSFEYQPLFLNKIVQRKEILERKGYKVRVLIMMSEKVFLNHGQESQNLLKMLKVQRV